MKLKTKYKMLAEIPEPQIIDKGDWIDLRSAETIDIPGPVVTRAKKNEQRHVVFDCHLLPLGVAMQLPKGFEAVVNPRSSMFIKYGCILSNSQGIIDNSYCGDNDEWKAAIIPMSSDVHIKAGERIVQFRIQLSQKATMWQKLKWLLSNGVKLVYVDELDNPNRGGHGTTGVK